MVREAIRQNIEDIIAEEDIISILPGTKVRIPLKSIKEFQFAFSEENPMVVQAPGAKKGDKIEKADPRFSQIPGPQAGDLPGEDVYEAEISGKELWEMIDEFLELPRLKEKSTEKTKKERKTRFRRTKKKGVIAKVNWSKTAEERIKRRKTQKRISKTPRGGGKK